MNPEVAMTARADDLPAGAMKRWAVPAAMVSAAAWIASGLFHYAFVYPEPGAGLLGSTSAYLIEAAHAVAEAGILLVLVRLLMNPIFRLGPVAVMGLCLSILGTSFLVLATLLVIVFLDGPGEGVLTALFGVGVLATLIGFPMLGVASFRARRALRWFGTLMFGYPFLFIAMMASYGLGGLALGAAWGAVAYVLHHEGVGKDRAQLSSAGQPLTP